MAEYKYPKIPKKYYPAVMFACKMIRENGNFNKAIKISSNYYDVDAEKVEKYVRERQAAGQRGKKRGTYKYYTVALICEETERFWYGGEEVVKALSVENASKIKEQHESRDGYHYYYVTRKVMKEYDTKEEAEKNLLTDVEEEKKRW